MTRPNILFFLSDQHSARFLGHRGHAEIHTPALDRLAAQGASFTQAYCQNPLCAPSRASLLSGKYSRNIGIYDNQHVVESFGDTFPRRLSEAGYRTCLIGKSHFNGEQFQGYQQRPYGDLYGQAHQPDPGRTPDGGESGLRGWPQKAGPTGIPLAMTQTEICVAESVKWLQTHTALHPDQPFLLSVHLDKPHFPVNCPQPFFDRYDGAVTAPDVAPDEDAVPFIKAANRCFRFEGDFDQAMGDKLMAAYCGSIEWIDDAIGRILASLEYLGLADDTLIVYSSDHGEMAGAHGTWQKTVFYEDSAKVPLIVRGPGGSVGIEVDDLVGLVDLYPTLCDAAGIESPESCDGVSLLPLLRGESIDRDRIFSESVILKSPKHAGCMLRTGDWKFNLYLDGARELYNLADDPDEAQNLAESPSQRERVAEFTGAVTEFWQPDEQMSRYENTPRMIKEKHFYPYSNQFVTGDGIVVDGRP